MSLAQPGKADSRLSPGLTLNLSSNNPFRNRAASPQSISPHASPQPSPLDAPPRPVSRNPFLDTSSTNINTSHQSPNKMSFGLDAKAPRPVLTGNAADLFDNLHLDDKPKPRPARPTPSRTNTGGGPDGSAKGENIPPRGPRIGHRPTRSQEDAMRARRAAGLNNRIARPKGELDIFADPSPQKHRARRNSESSISVKSLDPEEEKRRQERRRRERRHRENGKEGRPKKTDRKLDIIDKLDVTSIYGTGLFHHDGPFDACNPHRNRGSSRRAPMQAFPKDSLNNVLGGGGPLNKKPDHATFLGNNDDEAFRDYSGGGQPGYEPYGNGLFKSKGGESAVMSATTKVEPIHGEETLGLGTSTFLEGAPASRTAMQRRESEVASPNEGAGGLGRKKSLAQKIRGINNRRDYGGSRGVTSPGAMASPGTPNTPGGTQSDANPFFSEFSKGDDSKEMKKESVTFVEPAKEMRPREPGSPKGTGGPLERRVTSDGNPGAEQPAVKPSIGFLARVKSLKGGPRRPKDKNMGPPPPPPPSGT